MVGIKSIDVAIAQYSFKMINPKYSIEYKNTDQGKTTSCFYYMIYIHTYIYTYLYKMCR